MAFLLVKLENQLPLEEQIIVVNDYNILVTSLGKKVGDVVNLAFPDKPNVKYSGVVLYKGTKKACNMQKAERIKVLSEGSSSNSQNSQGFSIPGSCGRENITNGSQVESQTQWPIIVTASKPGISIQNGVLHAGRISQVPSQIVDSQNTRNDESSQNLISQTRIVEQNSTHDMQKATKNKRIVPSDASRKVFDNLMGMKSAVVLSERSLINKPNSLHLQQPPAQTRLPKSPILLEHQVGQGLSDLSRKRKKPSRIIYSSSSSSSRSPSPARRRNESQSPTRDRSDSRSTVDRRSRSRSRRRYTDRSRSRNRSQHQSLQNPRESGSRYRSRSRHTDRRRSLSRRRSRSHDHFVARSRSRDPIRPMLPMRSRSRSRRSESASLLSNLNMIINSDPQDQSQGSQDLFSQNVDNNEDNEGERVIASTVDGFEQRIKHLNEKIARLEAQQPKSCEESVQILRRAFPHHARANENGSDPSKVKIGERTEISRRVHTLTNWADPIQAVQELAVAFFGRDTLISHSVSGNVGPVNRDGPVKPALPEEPLIDIINEVILQYKSSNNDSLKVKIGNMETTLSSKILRGAVMKKTYSLCSTQRRHKRKEAAARLANGEEEEA